MRPHLFYFGFPSHPLKNLSQKRRIPMKQSANAAAKRSRTVVVLAIAVALILLGSILAQTFNTSFYNVKVSRISFETDSGTLSGLLYLPEWVSCIITSGAYPFAFIPVSRILSTRDANAPILSL